MTTQEQIDKFIAEQPEPKRTDMQALHGVIVQAMPACRLWFLDGRNDEGKVVTNPNIGYGLQTMHYADGMSREFYRIGLSATKSGISVYILGIKDKTLLARMYGADMGKASVSGYCIGFKALKDVNLDTLVAAIRHGAEAQDGAAPPG